MKNLLQSILITVGITFFNIALAAYKSPDYMWSGDAIVGQFLFGVIIGIIVAAANYLFRLKWPLVYIVAVHHFIVVASIFAINYEFLQDLGASLNLYFRTAIAYFIVWLYFYIDEKRSIQQMNEQLQKRGS